VFGHCGCHNSRGSFADKNIKKQQLRGAPQPSRELVRLKTKNVNDINDVIDLNQRKLWESFMEAGFRPEFEILLPSMSRFHLPKNPFPKTPFCDLMNYKHYEACVLAERKTARNNHNFECTIQIRVSEISDMQKHCPAHMRLSWSKCRGHLSADASWSRLKWSQGLGTDTKTYV
jgi:hypothetical protein